MKAIFVATLTLAFLATPLGVVAVSLLNLRIQRIEHHVALWGLCGSSVLIVLWIWIYFMGGVFGDVKLVTEWLWVLACLASALIILRKMKRIQTRSISVSIVPVLSILLVVVGMFYLVPRSFDGQITQRQLVGPDAIGYASAVAGLLEDGSFEELKARAITSSGQRSERELFDQDIRAVYAISDKSLSIKAEFITGSLRVGFPGLVALVTDKVGFPNLLTAMYVAAGMFVVIGALLIFELFRSRGCGRAFSLTVAVLATLNLNLLVGFHEGGVAQAFMFSATVIFLTASIHRELSTKARIFLYMTAYIQAISTYSDMFFVFTGVVFVWWLISVMARSQVSIQRSTHAFFGMCLGLVVLAPLSIRLPAFVLRRFADARQGGWNWNSWTELTAILGLSDPYYESSPDSIISQLVLIALVYVVARGWKMRAPLDINSETKIFTISVAVFSMIFYIYSRHIMEHTTYQWFKFVGTFLGPLSVPLVSVFVPLEKLQIRRKNFFSLSVILLTIALNLSTSIEYVRHYFSNSRFIPSSSISEVANVKFREVSKKYQVFGTYDWEEFALIPFSPAQFLNRRDQGVTPIVREDLPVGLIIRERDCDMWQCIRDVPSENKIVVGKDYLIVDLNLMGSDIRNVSEYIQWIRVNRALVKLGAPKVERNWSTFLD